jgi:hypothetical protein
VVFEAGDIVTFLILHVPTPSFHQISTYAGMTKRAGMTKLYVILMLTTYLDSEVTHFTRNHIRIINLERGLSMREKAVYAMAISPHPFDNEPGAAGTDACW